MAKRKTTEEFIKDARKVHGDKYDYSKVAYKNKRTKIIIVCPEHGEFEQTPDSHLQGNGCIKCKYKKLGEKRNHRNVFIENANKIHNNKYSYEKVNYKNSSAKVTITCLKHGDFEQTPAHHIFGHGCPKCGIISMKNKTSSNTERFVEKAKSIHSDNYDYSKVVYINNRFPVEIICPKHGSFLQAPKKHLIGEGCPKCILKTQTKIYEFLKESFPKYHWIWEYNDKWLNKQRIDICCEAAKLAVEYNGPQHYMPLDNYGGKSEFYKTRKRDCNKQNLCKQNGFYLYIIKYDDVDYDRIRKDINNILNCNKNEN